jgi:hypothetical protein
VPDPGWVYSDGSFGFVVSQLRRDRAERRTRAEGNGVFRGVRGGDRRMTVKWHRRAAWSRQMLAQMWERAGEKDLARVERSRAIIHARAADIKRELEAVDGRDGQREAA